MKLQLKRVCSCIKNNKEPIKTRMPSISSTLLKMCKPTRGRNSTGKLFPVKALQHEKISIHQVIYTM